VDMDRVNALAVPRGIAVLEDCAQSTGAELNGRRAGSMSNMAAFSFYPTKILGTYGDGGMIVTNDDAAAARLRRIRMYGTERTYYSEEHGYNSRLDEVHAEILRRKLRHLDAYIARRRELAARYDERLRDVGLVLPRTAARNHHAYYLYVVRHPERDRIIRELAARDIVVNISYPWPIHTMRGYVALGYAEGSLPHTENAAREIFSLPMFPALTNDDQDRVCEALREILRQFAVGRAASTPA